MPTGFTTVFQGNTVYQSPLSYAAYNITSSAAPLVLQWALDNFPANGNVVAKIMDVNCTAVSGSLQLPAATNATAGETTLINNTGTQNLIVYDDTNPGVSGTILATLVPGSLWQFYLRSNATQAGTWGAFQYGAQVSALNASNLASNSVIAIGTTLNQSMPVKSLSAATYTLSTAAPPSGDRDQFLVNTGGASVWTLPAASAAGAGWYVQIRNQGTGGLTLQAGNNIDQINGVSGSPATISLNVKDSCFITSDGTNWWTIGLTNLLNAGFQYNALSITSGYYQLPTTITGNGAIRLTGTLTGNVTIGFPTSVAQYIIDNETVQGTFTIQIGIGGSSSLTQGTPISITTNNPASNAAYRSLVYSDGTSGASANTGLLTAVTTASGVVQVSGGGTGATTAGGALINLGGTSVGISLFTAASQAAAQTAMGVDQILNPMLWA
jgi:hypothetical protein